jgi:type I restriction enzyme S subunit
MISAAFLKTLLDGHGPQLRTLGELGTFIRGSGIQKSDFTESGTGCIHYGQIHTHYGTWATETKSFISHEFATPLRKAQKGDLVIATTSEDDEAVAKAVAWLGMEAVAVSNDAYIYRHAANPKYMSYFFQTEFFQSQKRAHITGTKVRRISGDNLAKIQIPIPCPDNTKKSLEIQAEIVLILDTFTELTVKLTTELTAELTARKKQQNYYRDRLLSFEGGEVEWKMLGEVATIGTGSHDTQDAITDGEYMFYARGREPLRLNEFDFDETAIITAGDGAGVGKVFHYAQGRYALHQRAYRIVPGETMNPRFVYHCLKSHFYAYIQKASVSSSVTSLRRPMFLNFPIPAPSLADQARIVAILDRFDALTDSLCEGLPREIELRQKQYAYYRDLLLSFPKPEEVEV